VAASAGRRHPASLLLSATFDGDEC